MSMMLKTVKKMKNSLNLVLDDELERRLLVVLVVLGVGHDNNVVNFHKV
jgi:hypothetical protein